MAETLPPEEDARAAGDGVTESVGASSDAEEGDARRLDSAADSGGGVGTSDAPPLDARAPVDGAVGLGQGNPCSLAEDCVSGFCVDGVCCDRTCKGSCEACDVVNSAGRCTLVASGQPHNKPECGGTGECKGQCAGGSAQCAFPPASTPCGSASCSSTTLTKRGTCDGAGQCTVGTATSCGAFLCIVDHCLTSCTKNSDCAADNFCDVSSGACISQAAEIGVGSEHSCAILTDGTVWCWGQNSDKQLGVDTGGSPATKPVELIALAGKLRTIGGGSRFSCGLTTDSKVLCWGTGALGAGESASVSRFGAKAVIIGNQTELSVVKMLSVTYHYACAVRDDGVWCWGPGGKLGSKTANGLVAALAVGEAGISSLYTAIGSAVALRNGTGDVFEWGDSALRDGYDIAPPVKFYEPNIVAVGMDDPYTCFVDGAGALKCPTAAGTYMDWRTIEASVSGVVVNRSGVCAILAGGTVACGWPSIGPLTEQANLRNPKKIVAESYGEHYCALAPDGNVLCWGSNSVGQLGIGTKGETQQKPPSPVHWR